MDCSDLCFGQFCLVGTKRVKPRVVSCFFVMKIFLLMGSEWSQSTYIYLYVVIASLTVFIYNK